MAKRIPILHPFLFAIYPILSLLAHNISEVSISDATRAFLSAIIAAFILLLLLRLLLKDWEKAGLIATTFLVWFFSYAHIYNLFKKSEFQLMASIGRHRYIVPASVLLIIAICWWITRRMREPRPYTSFLNIVAACSLLIPIYTIANYKLRSAGQVQNDHMKVVELQILDHETAPDVYYIVLDSYAREDTLREVFDYDNAPFIEALTQRGFYVVQQGRTNYGRTGLSIASSLNIDYLQNLIEGLNPGSRQSEPLWELIQNSVVRRAFEGAGYLTVAFSTGYEGTELKDADIYYTGGALDQILGMNAFNNFEGMLIDNSAFLIAIDGATVLPLLFPNLEYPYQLHREWVLGIFDHLATLPKMEEPKFIFAHIISPHSPFVFQRDGSPVERSSGFTFGFTFGDGSALTGEAYIHAYRDQLHYINTKLLETVDAILTHSERPPIIIIQSDHGPIPEGSNMGYVQQRMSIFHAYYLPDGGIENLYSTVTPVNTFRIIFNTYFGTDLEILDDRIYFSVYPKIFKFSDVTETTD